jgi:hypothetical protein
MQAATGFWQASKSFMMSALLYPAVKLQQVSHFVNQATSFPIRATQALTQEIPGMQTLLETLNTIKDKALPAAEASTLVWMALLEFQRHLSVTPSVPMQSWMVNDLMVALSPYLTYATLGYGAMAAMTGVGTLTWVGLNGVAAVGKGLWSGKDLVKAIVDENLAIFRNTILTPANIEAQGLKVLNAPIALPHDLKVLLTTAEKESVLTKVAHERLRMCLVHFPGLRTEDYAQIVVTEHKNTGTPVYLPSQGPRAVVPVRSLEDQFAALRIDGGVVEQVFTSQTRIIIHH